MTEMNKQGNIYFLQDNSLAIQHNFSKLIFHESKKSLALFFSYDVKLCCRISFNILHVFKSVILLMYFQFRK